MQGADRYVTKHDFDLPTLMKLVNQMTHIPVTDEGYRYPEGKAKYNLISVLPQYQGFVAVLEVL